MDMQPRSLPTYRCTSTRCYVAISYIGKSVPLLSGQNTYKRRILMHILSSRWTACYLFLPSPSNNIWKKIRPTYHEDVISSSLQPPVTSLRPIICPLFHSEIPANCILNLEWETNFKDPYKSTGDITLLCISKYLWFGQKNCNILMLYEVAWYEISVLIEGIKY